MSQLDMFAQNIVLLVGLLFCGCGGIFLLIAVWTGSNILVWQVRKQREERRIYGDEPAGDGVRLPRVTRGACERCGNVFNEVYTQDDGVQLCPRCLRLYGETPGESGESPEPAEESDADHAE